MKMPKNRDDFEWLMLHAFSCGLQNGYGINHENLREEEEYAIKEFAHRCGFKREKV